METLLQDLRYGLRTLLKNPGFTFVAVLVLGLGLGANTGIFSVINAVLLRRLPYSEPDRLVLLFERDVLAEGAGRNVVSLANFLDWQAQSRSFEYMAVARANRFNLGADRGNSAAPERIEGAICSWGLFSVLGVQPLLGRTFTPEEDKPGARQVAVISYVLWQHAFGRCTSGLNRKTF